jgi:hypothetical protein
MFLVETAGLKRFCQIPAKTTGLTSQNRLSWQRCLMLLADDILNSLQHLLIIELSCLNAVQKSKLTNPPRVLLQPLRPTKLNDAVSVVDGKHRIGHLALDARYDWLEVGGLAPRGLTSIDEVRNAILSEAIKGPIKIW